MVAYQSYQTQITGDGIFSMTSLAKHYFFDANMQPVEFKVERGHPISFQTSSSELGTIGGHFDRDNLKTQIAFARDGKLSFVDLPGPAQAQLYVVAAKNSAYFAGSEFLARKPIEYRNKKFSELPVPPGVTSVRLTAASSNGDYIMTVTHVDHSKKTNLAALWSRQALLVQGGKFYDLKHFLRSNGLENAVYDRDEAYVQINQMDENGDFAVMCNQENFRHLFLMRRLN